MSKHNTFSAMFSLILFSAAPLPAHADAYDSGMDAYQAGDYTQALYQWKPLAEHGHAQAAYNLGFMYEFGYGVERNDVESFGYYLRAAQHGHAQAQHTVAWMYGRGKGVIADRAQAVKWASISASSTASGNTADADEIDTQIFLDQLISEFIKAETRYDVQQAKQGKQKSPPVELEASNETS